MIRYLIDKSSINRAYFVIAGFVSLSFFALVGCNDDASLVGGGLMPQKDVIQGSSQSLANVTAQNVIKGAVISDKVEYALLGEFNDPVFGYSKSEFATQINSGAALDSVRFNLSGFGVDSLQLNLVHYASNGWYGDTAAIHVLKVYELTEPLQNNEIPYYSDFSMDGKYNPVPIGELEFKTNRNTDSAWYSLGGEDTLRINLSQELTNRFFNELTKDIIADNNYFKQSFFKGLYITSSLKTGGEGSLLRYRVWGDNLGLKMYYHYVKDKDTTYFINLFPISVEGADFNLFKHTPSTEIEFNNTSVNYLYAQGMAGSYINVKLPDDIFNYADSLGVKDDGYNYQFSSVSLELFVDTAKSQFSRYTAPSTLQLFRKNEKSGKIEVPFMNYELDSDTIYNSGVVSYGTFDSSTNSYRFVISNDFFERVVTKDDDLPIAERKGKGSEDDFQDLYIGPATPSQNLNRVVIYGKDNTEKQGVVFKVRRVKFK